MRIQRTFKTTDNKTSFSPFMLAYAFPTYICPSSNYMLRYFNLISTFVDISIYLATIWLLQPAFIFIYDFLPVLFLFASNHVVLVLPLNLVQDNICLPLNVVILPHSFLLSFIPVFVLHSHLPFFINRLCVLFWLFISRFNRVKYSNYEYKFKSFFSLKYFNNKYFINKYFNN